MTIQRPFIALDIGTSFIKGAVLDLTNFEIQHIQRRPFPQPVDGLKPNFYEVDPERLVGEVQRLVESLLTYAHDVQGIVTSTQMHGLVLTDLKYQPLTNVITWRDQHAIGAHPSGKGSYFDVLAARLTDDERRELGNGLRAALPINTLFWLAQEGQLPDQQAIPLTLSEYVLARLCDGPIHPQIEPTNAGAHGAFHMSNSSWHMGVINKLGLESLRWPEIGTIYSTIGTKNFSGTKVPIYASVGDHQCALMGAFLQNRELSLNVSTGSQASLITPTLTLGNHETRPYFDGRFLNTLVKIPAGRSLDLLVSLLTEIGGINGHDLTEPWRAIIQAVDRVSETDLGIDLSFFDSAAASAGSISNIREDNFSIGHLFRAAFQSMARNYVDGGERLAVGTAGSDAKGGAGWDRIVFSGGLVQKLEPLRQTILQAFGNRNLKNDYRICAEEEDTLLGLMVLAYCISGEADSVAEATQIISAQQI